MADAGFDVAWKEDSINWRLEQRIRVILNGLGRTLPRNAFDHVVERTGAMEVEVPPDTIEGIAWALGELGQRYRLAIVRDAIVTPGTGLRELIVHIGDRDHNDVKGPHAVGAKAVLFTAIRDNDRATTTADAICDHHFDLPAIIDRLA